jgi:GTP pyrophosphokinase
MAKNTQILSSHFTEALVYATRLHAGQVRKGTQIPYVAHLLSVAALVLEAGGDEDEAIAALLHDAVEDQGGLETLTEIQRRFGDRVAVIVEGCSDAYTQPKPPWRKRKESYLAHLSDASPEVRRVSLADKLHNARSIHRDLQENGTGLFSKFNGGKSGTLWYYSRLVEIFEATESSPMTYEFAQVVRKIQSFVEQTK